MKEITDFAKAYRYMGVDKPTAELSKLMTELAEEVREVARPRQLSEVYPAVVEDGYYRLVGTDIRLVSEDINKLFRDVSHIAMSAVTLGSLIDRRVEYYSRTSGVKMMVFDALSSVYVEDIADELTAELGSRYPDKHMTVRYSCGYGDLSIDLQPQIIETLDATRRAGIVCESGLMRPLKSITSFEGLSDRVQPIIFDCVHCRLNRCGGVDCPRRKI